MKAIKKWLVCSLAVSLCIGVWGKTKLVESRWVASVVKIDAALDDWGPMPTTSEDSLSIDYSFQNDANNLYVYVKFNDARYISTLMLSGMTIWINLEGKNKKTVGIRFYNRQVPAELVILEREKQLGTPLSEEAKQQIRQMKVHDIHQCYLVEDKETPIPFNHPLNPEFKGQRSANGLTFEYRIPLRFLEPIYPGTPKPQLEAGKQVTIGFEWGGMNDQMRAEMLKNSGERMQSNNRRADGIGDLTRTDDRYAGGSLLDESAEMGVRRGPKKYNFWVDVKLVQQ